MMRTDTQFREEILRRKNAVIRRRRRTVSALSATAVCLLLLFWAFWLRPPSVDRFDGENTSEDVIVYIYMGGKTIEDGDAVSIRMEALGKYAPLPEDDCDAVFEDFANDNFVSSDSAHGSVPETTPSTDDSFKGADQSLVSTGLPAPTDPDGRRCSFTVFVGHTSKTYHLKEYSVTVDKTKYTLTEAQFEELWALFGEEDRP